VTSVLWFQGGACSGNTMSFINAAEPSVVDLIVDYGLEIVYHPTLSMEIGQTAQDLFWSYAKGEKEVDIFVYEGSIIRAPENTGRFDMFAGRPMKDWVDDIAPRASIVVAIGDCATWGGLPAVPPNPSDSTGLQFDRGGKMGGYLGADFRSKLGLPVINIPGCPAHPDWIGQILVALAAGRVGDLALDELNRPSTFFTSFTQTGCTRVQFFAYKQDPPSFGQGTRTGCLFYEYGCRGPMTHSPCNRILWNRQSSKTRAGMPCTGCTEPGYPHGDLEVGTVFKTKKIAGVIPAEEPTGIDPASYMALASLSRAVAPDWSKKDMFVV
jgi:NiFe hydrogenase small subunit HydA